MDFQTRLSNLNKNQLSAVQELSQNLLIIAGPGTGKTELLSMRTANILKQTDVLPSNILCLTFTDSASVNMRQRLQQIIGESAYKVAIHTFHSFGVEIINQNREYFFRGSEFNPADELAQYQIIHQIFESLDYSHPLSSKNDNEFVYLKSVLGSISEFKKSGLTVDELRLVIQSNQQIIDHVNPEVTKLFANNITKSTIPQFASLTEKLSTLNQTDLPIGVSSYAKSLIISMAHASQEAIETGKTNSITAWKNTWCKKNQRKETVLIDSLNTEKLLATIDLYDKYIQAMGEAKLYDYDDMILNVIDAVNKHQDLRANLQEQFQYIMVDEFQDTNLAQLRLLFSIVDKQSTNVMAVGDDDQAIYSFQGADIGNIQRFREFFDDPQIIVLTDNYRSTDQIIDVARSVITQGVDRLENTITDLSKELTPWFNYPETKVEVSEYPTPDNEKIGLVQEISRLINQGTSPEQIVVLARRHYELIELLPYFNDAQIRVNYEKRDNALDHEVVILLEKLARVVIALRGNDQVAANALLPELISHPAFGFQPLDIWKLSLGAYRNRQLWLENMISNSSFQGLANWLIKLASQPADSPLESQIIELLGSAHAKTTDEDEYASPLYNYFFAANKLSADPRAYLDALEAFRTIRDKLREHFVTESPDLADFVSFIDLYRQMNSSLTVVRGLADYQKGLVNLMSAHGAKGLEFDHVFIIGANDKSWGEKAHGKSRLIRYPVNLSLQPSGDSYDERLRLFFVAMTRARKTLDISFSSSTNSQKSNLVASFLSSQPIQQKQVINSTDDAVHALEIDWRARLSQPVTADLKELLAPTLENYKLSVTHLNNFIDVSSGGPQNFLLNNLLQFPQGLSPSASYGTAVHHALQQAHNLTKVDGKLPEILTILDIFTDRLTSQRLTEDDFQQLNTRGRQALQAYFNAKSDSFTQSQITELDFSGQGVVFGEAKLTGKLDLVDINKSDKTLFVTDYKTGKSSRKWSGETSYEKIKLHKYRQQLMFYQLLVEKSRDYSNYQFTGARLQFVEPEQGTGDILGLEDSFSREELDDFRKLIEVIYQKIITLDLPDTSNYSPDIKGIKQFEEDLLQT